MDFELNEDQIAFADMARSFAQKELEPHAAMWDEEQIFPVDTLKKAGELGFCGLYASEDVGGLGLSRLDASIIFEELAMGCTSTTAYITIHNMSTWMIAEFGNSDTRMDWCPKLTAGEQFASYCLTEPNAGSDAASLKTTARRDGDGYVINGSKIFISGAGSTDVLVVMARTGEAGAKGISAFVVDAKLPGISYGRKEQKMGWNSQPTRMITFDDVRVPASAILGAEGDGFKIAMKGLDGGRINIGACSIGTAQAALQRARDYMLDRSQFGKTLSNFQALQFKIADMTTQLVAARQMIRMAASRLDAGHPDRTVYCAMAKQFATDAGYNIADEALQIFGGNGYIKEYPMERYLRDNRVHRILEGTNEIMRLIIARRALMQDCAKIL
ncbi:MULTISPECIES: acyl-CoA dehydrogenase family protein [unclassified Marinobacterium]|jgi:alkylation response protein AidB-like acyl-CoA dehydrogenase|uniref:acyl-CoA dehydrogenase family protein n=1 Tax=unclassified Marinobacterium TaxID=2644139 RepID=UPI001569C65E|nr:MULTISPECIES: acyl-CoA dehydrogenase family protein [unclassified Marinobacterium]NRP10635.1 Acryloyl-CoA reductase (NADH) [Marinobacterium sp. xm-g-48]NRP36858.1 Acryloyl-CoA reductase (NADH) [Marinobacterium sp. xm-d-579]NRP46755.1 Acryloyl-CoA reductase (NADH) [Marinobacterium sp. xm-d-543]NRP59387.1 Acryloyl-CoA reductase (NADH) [Marinobacterium sp. xm-d-564]NRP83661.1 Acryloyl-CoA reductase (NADH) [Marinobacterium sp. xm-d-509]